MYIGADGFPAQDPDVRIVQDPNYNWTGSVRSSFRYRKLQLSGCWTSGMGGRSGRYQGRLWSYGVHKDTEVRAVCTSQTNCTGNDKVFGQGGWLTDPWWVRAPGRRSDR